MKKLSTKLAVALAALTLAVVSVIGVDAKRADAHIETGHAEDCEGISLSLDWFPEGESIITITGAVSVEKVLEGPAGTVTATWEELGYDESTPGAGWHYTATWDVHGGGQAGPYTFIAKGCAPAIEPVLTVPQLAAAAPECGFDHFPVSVTGEGGDTPREYTVADGRGFSDTRMINPGETVSYELPIAPGETVEVSIDLGGKGGNVIVTAPSEEECVPVELTPPQITKRTDEQPKESQQPTPVTSDEVPVLAYTGREHAFMVAIAVGLFGMGTFFCKVLQPAVVRREQARKS